MKITIENNTNIEIEDVKALHTINEAMETLMCGLWKYDNDYMDEHMAGLMRVQKVFVAHLLKQCEVEVENGE